MKLRALFILACCALALAPLLGCASRPTLQLQGIETQRVLLPEYVTAVYRAIDENTADIFLSDLPADQIEGRLSNAASGLAGTPGVVIHIHVFLTPVAGRTPIEFSASNVSMTAVVMTGESVGIYAGGAFCLPSTAMGRAKFKGRLREGTMRLVHSEQGFEDMLGATEVSGRVFARRDDNLAGRISERMAVLLGSR